MKASSENQRSCGVGGGRHTERKSDTEKQDKPRNEDLVSDFDLGTISQLIGHWKVA